jgi:hypothetical protein
VVLARLLLFLIFTPLALDIEKDFLTIFYAITSIVFLMSTLTRIQMRAMDEAG